MEAEFYLKNKKDQVYISKSSKQVITDSQNQYALVLKNDENSLNNNTNINENIDTSKFNFSEVKNNLERKFGDKGCFPDSNNKKRFKEKNLVIKVKKNMNEEELEQLAASQNYNKEKDCNFEIKGKKYMNEEELEHLLASQKNNKDIDNYFNDHSNINKVKPEKGKEDNFDNNYRCNFKEDNVKKVNDVETKKIINDINNYEDNEDCDDNFYIEPLL